MFTHTDPTPTTESKPTFPLLAWQFRNRELREPNQQEAIHELVPIWVNKEAGGQGKIPDDLGRDLIGVECFFVEEGCKDGSLMPYEAAMQFGVSGEKVVEHLVAMGVPIPPCPGWVAPWARTNTRKGKKPEWETKTVQHLNHYWKLSILRPSTIAQFLQRTVEEVLVAADWFGLPEKIDSSRWDCPDWRFQTESETDPKLLDSDTQREVAEASATRFALIYEELHQLDANTETPQNEARRRRINREIDLIITLHSRIFEKFIGARARKYTQFAPNPAHTQTELEQAGHTAIFERLRRWHPNRKIHFSRRAVDTAINREMISHLEQQRLIALPDKIRAYARKLKAANDNGTFEEEMGRLMQESSERCVTEAAKHQHSYAFVSTVPIMDVYSESEAEAHGVQAFDAPCKENFQTFHQPEAPQTDAHDLIFKAAERLNPFERRAILAYYGFEEDGTHIGRKTLEEIGQVEGVTKERIRQRIAKGAERMRKWLASRDIRSVEDALATE